MNKVGLWKMIPTVTGTGGSVDSDGNVIISSGTTAGVVINDCFTDDFRNYRIIVSEATMSTSGFFTLRLSENGTPNTTANSYTRIGGIATGGALTFSTETINNFFFGSAGTTASLNAVFDMTAPKIATPTHWNCNSFSSSAWFGTMGRHNQSTAYDGLEIDCNTGTMNCRVSVYGYN
jgi:hypothetical protein